MVVFLRRNWLKGGFLASLLALSLLTVSLQTRREDAVSATAPLHERGGAVVIVDAGHGGADGGAVSIDGVEEADINLAVARRTEAFLAFLGQRTVLTRRDENSLADNPEDTLRRQKISDTKNRVALVSRYDEAVFLSIHQNTLPGHPSVRGAQVFYNAAPAAPELAAAIQEKLNAQINLHNEKTTRKAGEDVYMMAHITCPGVLVECGFLSNGAETARLQSAEYQGELAFAITMGYLQWKEQKQ